MVRGQVEVADFKSGQIAQVMGGQQATTFTTGKVGVSLQGSGTFAPIEQGKPRSPAIAPVQVPRGGLSAPRNAANDTSTKPPRSGGTEIVKPGVIRISAPIGQVRVNVHKATNGLARDPSAANGGGRNTASKGTVWQSNSNANANQGGNSPGGNSNANGNGGGNGNAAGSPSTGPTVAATAGGGKGNGNGGNNGNGNGSGGAHGNGKGNGNGHGNGNGNGNGNSGNGNGNGNGFGRGRH